MPVFVAGFWIFCERAKGRQSAMDLALWRPCSALYLLLHYLNLSVTHVQSLQI